MAIWNFSKFQDFGYFGHFLRYLPNYYEFGQLFPLEVIQCYNLGGVMDKEQKKYGFGNKQLYFTPNLKHLWSKLNMALFLDTYTQFWL